jgi:hypothetical protein
MWSVCVPRRFGVCNTGLIYGSITPPVEMTTDGGTALPAIQIASGTGAPFGATPAKTRFRCLKRERHCARQSNGHSNKLVLLAARPRRQIRVRSSRGA